MKHFSEISQSKKEESHLLLLTSESGTLLEKESKVVLGLRVKDRRDVG